MPDALPIRFATPADAPAIHACMAAAFAPYRERYTPAGYRDTVPDPEGIERRIREMTVLVADDGAGGVAGTVGCWARGNGEGHVRGMAVRPEHQGSGLAGRLLAAAEAELRRRGCTRVTLDTTRPLHRATRFYARQGYRPTGAVGDFFGMPLVEYARDLET